MLLMASWMRGMGSYLYRYRRGTREGRYGANCSLACAAMDDTLKAAPYAYKKYQMNPIIQTSHISLTFLEFQSAWWLARCMNLYTKSG